MADEYERHNALAGEESHANEYDADKGDSYDQYDTVDTANYGRSNNDFNLDIPNLLPENDVHLTHNLDGAMSMLNNSYREKQLFAKAKYMCNWEEGNQSKLQTMLNLTEQSQLRPIFTKDLYKYRKSMIVAPSMATMRLLNDGVKFGIKSAQRVQSLVIRKKSTTVEHRIMEIVNLDRRRKLDTAFEYLMTCSDSDYWLDFF